MNAAALDRRIKKNVHAQPHRVRLEPAPGWDDVLESEAGALLSSFSLPSKFKPQLLRDAEGLWIENLDFRNLIELPLRLLTAADGLWALHSRHVGSFAALLRCLEQIDWELYLPPGAVVRIKVDSYRSKLFHEGKLQGLITEHLMKKGFRVDQERGGLRLLFEQIENRHTVYFSLAGDPLYQRRYKKLQQHSAPLQEHLAAAALRWFMELPVQRDQQWTPDQLYVPFAGSGTFFMEAMLLLGELPAFRWRLPHYATLRLPCLPAASWKQIISRLDQKAEKESPLPPALLIEKDVEVHKVLQENVDHFIQGTQPSWGVQPPLVVLGDGFQQTLAATPARILMPLNPPYGQRLAQGLMSPVEFYEALGYWLRGLGKVGRDLRGFVLIPDSHAERALVKALHPAAVLATHSFTQGGQHIRCLAFKVGTGTGEKSC